jgi:uncharacterized membrane protein YgcG
MAWDSSRPVPWKRLIKEWLLYAGVMAAIFLLLFRNANVFGAIVGILISGPLYLLFGAVLAKFGYTRKTMKELRSERNADSSSSGKSSGTSSGKSSASSPSDESSGDRMAPAPTRRTSTGYNRPTAKQKRR